MLQNPSVSAVWEESQSEFREKCWEHQVKIKHPGRGGGGGGGEQGHSGYPSAPALESAPL